MAPTRRRTKLLHRAAIVAASLLAFFPGARAEEVLRVSGTGTALGALKRLAAAFEAASPGVRVRVLPSIGSTGAAEAVVRGALDIGVLGRQVQASERALGLTGTPFARTAFVFAVGSRTGTTSVTSEQLAKIYRGEIRAWPGGERVRIVLRPRRDVDDAILRSISGEIAAAVELAHAREGMILAMTNQECDDILTRTPGAIGTTSLTQIVTNGGKPTPLAWNGVAPTLANLASNAYPLTKTLVLAFRANPPPAVRRFLAFMETSEARTILQETGNLPLPVSHVD